MKNTIENPKIVLMSIWTFVLRFFYSCTIFPLLLQVYDYFSIFVLYTKTVEFEKAKNTSFVCFSLSITLITLLFDL